MFSCELLFHLNFDSRLIVALGINAKDLYRYNFHCTYNLCETTIIFPDVASCHLQAKITWVASKVTLLELQKSIGDEFRVGRRRHTPPFWKFEYLFCQKKYLHKIWLKPMSNLNAPPLCKISGSAPD